MQEFSQTLAHGNIKNEMTEREEKNRCVSMERSKEGTKNYVPKAYRPPETLRPETVDEFPN